MEKADLHTMEPWRPLRANVLLLYFFLILAAATLIPQLVQFPYGFVRDDGYFYAQIAYNIGSVGHSTFDGLHTIDGYHLLWAWLLAALSALLSLFHVAKPYHLTAYVALNLFIILLVAHLFSKGLLQSLGYITLMLLSSLLTEGQLLALVTLCLVALLLEPEQQRSHAWVFAVAFLSPLVRIDSVLMLIPVVAAATWIHRRIGLVAAGGLILGAGADFLIRFTLFGSPFSVSATLKASSAVPSPDRLLYNLVYTSHAGLPLNPLLLTLIGLAVMALIVLVYSELPRAAKAVLLGATIGAVFFSGTHLLTQVMRPWYYTAPLCMCYFALVQASEHSRIRWLRLGERVCSGGLLVAAGLMVTYTALKSVNQSADIRAVERFIARLDEVVPPGGRIIDFGLSGIHAFHSSRTIVNAEGYVNSHEYAERILTNRLQGYLDENRICWIVTTRDFGSPLIDFHGLVVSVTDVTLALEDLAPSYRDAQQRLWHRHRC